MPGDDTWWQRQRSSFGDAAAAYERGRPGYPRAALDWLLPPGARRVLDLGAGTGKLARLLAARGLDVVTVEPSAGMRLEFARAVPGVPVLGGTAEAVPLADGSVDAVLVTQAWHWVDVPAASRRPRASWPPAAGSAWCGTCATPRPAGSATSSRSSGRTSPR